MILWVCVCLRVQSKKFLLGISFGVRLKVSGNKFQIINAFELLLEEKLV